MIATGSSYSDPPDTAYCQQIREQYGLQMPVLIDPTGSTIYEALNTGRHADFVLGRGAVVTFRDRWASTNDEVSMALDELLNQWTK